MWRAVRTAIVAVVFLTISTNSLPLSSAEVGEKHIERRRISYSVVAVDGAMETPPSEIPMTVTVPGVPYFPPADTVTVSATETVTVSAPERTVVETTVVDPTSVTSLETPITSNLPFESQSRASSTAFATPIVSSTSSNPLYPSRPTERLPGRPVVSGSSPSSYAPAASITDTNLSFHSPTLTPQSTC